MNLILPTQQIVADLMQSLNDSPVLRPDADKLFDRLLAQVTFKNKAKETLLKDRYSYYKVLESIDPHGAKDASLAIYRAGLELLELLSTFDAYYQNHLVYLKDRWVGYDLIMVKMTHEDIPEIR